MVYESTEARRKAGKLSPFHDAYSAPDPEMYMQVGEQNYRPTQPILPEYTKTILDCAALFGNTSLNAQFGWDFKRSCEFWKEGVPLSDEQREKTLLNRRLRMIGCDVMPLALDYSKRMNILDETIVQNFTDEMSEEIKGALKEADVWIMQQCMSHMPLENLKQWVAVFLQDRSRPKRFIYDYNPYFDKRNMSPEVVLEGIQDYESTERFYAYRDKTDFEYSQSQENGRDMCVYHYVVDFHPVAA